MGLGLLDSRKRSESVTPLKNRPPVWATGIETRVGECKPWPIHTRSCAPSCSDYAATSSWILCRSVRQHENLMVRICRYALLAITTVEVRCALNTGLSLAWNFGNVVGLASGGLVRLGLERERRNTIHVTFLTPSCSSFTNLWISRALSLHMSGVLTSSLTSPWLLQGAVSKKSRIPIVQPHYLSTSIICHRNVPRTEYRSLDYRS